MKSTYIIGEIGQNHNGSVDIAKLIVDLVSRPVREEVFNLELRPMDAVKMTKRDLSEELTDSQMNRPYDSPHSFGRTYGEHRAYLELTDEEHDVFRRGRNANVHSIPHHADRADYQKATGLEALFGWLYLRDDHARINELFNLMMEDDDAT